MSDLDESAWGAPRGGHADDSTHSATERAGSDADADADADAGAGAVPLQYAALWAECQPSGNTVALQQLGRVLSRASLPNESCALILEDSCAPGKQRVGEAQFYRALALAAAVQENPTLDVRTETAPMRELTLAAEPQNGPEEPLPAYNPASKHTVLVELMSKREGSFLSRHAVYTVSGEFQDKQFRVLRRFRDFAWLGDSLIHKYPFRAVPVLPPKRLVVTGGFLATASEDVFLHRRAAGLARFVNLLVKHPILARDPLVKTFLFADTQFELVRGRSLHENEFDGRVASPLFISQWSASRVETWERIEAAANEFLQQVTSACVVLDRARVRALVARDDAEILGCNCFALSRSLHTLYPTQQVDLGAIQTRLEAVAQYSEASKAALVERSDALASGPLAELRMYREMLGSLLDLFRRYHAQGGNSIPELERKISTTQNRLATLATRENASEDALHKLRTAIQTAQASIREQVNRDWLVKTAMSEELELMQAMQYQISRILRSLASAMDSSATREAELAAQMADAAATAPFKI